MATSDLRIEKLAAEHDLGGFDCGDNGLNTWLRRFALANARGDATQTYVAVRNGAVVGYFGLAAFSIDHGSVPERAARGLARHPLPSILLARLAVDRREAGKGLGRALVQDALLRCASAAEIIGARLVIVHALNDMAARFYERCGFEPCLGQPQNLVILMKDVRSLCA